MTGWEIAPPGYMIDSFDSPKFTYRKYVEDLVHSTTVESTKKRTFVTISTNVLCAEIASKNPDLDPADRDIYKPLEIALTKWSVADYKHKSKELRTFTSKTWILNPGTPDYREINYARDHKPEHKIDYENFSPTDSYVEKNLKKIVEEINELLKVDRTVFSNTLKHCRQDLGCLKWLNRETGYKMKPINVYSVEDLYVVLLRKLCPEGRPEDFICQGVARFSFKRKTNSYDDDIQCQYHRDRVSLNSELQCENCAKLIADQWGHVILDDIREMLSSDQAEPQENGVDQARPRENDLDVVVDGVDQLNLNPRPGGSRD